MLERSSIVKRFILDQSDQWFTDTPLKRKIRKNKRNLGMPMTICVATIAQGTIFGAADRMLTAGDIEFEPAQSKLFQLSNSIVAMMSGDSAFQGQLLTDLRQWVTDSIAKNPSVWTSIKETADEYARIYSHYALREATREKLTRLGLDSNSFIARQKEMDSEFIRKLGTEMLLFEAPKAEVIIAGIDVSGAHLYVVDDGKIQCADWVGFAAIGAGAYHADSYLMFAKYVKSSPIPLGLWSTYAAKKRAETAPGVGVHTDMFILGVVPGSYDVVRQDIMNKLEEIYQTSVRGIEQVNRTAEAGVTTYVQQIVSESAAQAAKTEGQAPPQITDGDKPTNNKTDGGRTKPPPKARKPQ